MVVACSLALKESNCFAKAAQNCFQNTYNLVLNKQETKSVLSTALWSLRSDSPRLFFLSDHDLLSMLADTFNDLPALQKFFEKVFPKLSNIILLDGTDLTVSKKVTKDLT